MRPLSLLLFALLAVPALAQTAIDVGIAVGTQSYRSYSDDPRILTGGEVLLRRGAVGFHVAAEYADLTEESALIVVHPDLVYRWPLGSNFAAMAGAGPTLTNIGGSGGGMTWNAELEVEKRWSRSAVFGRIRHYDYELQRSRGGEAGPNGPAIYLGVRVNISS